MGPSPVSVTVPQAATTRHSSPAARLRHVITVIRGVTPVICSSLRTTFAKGTQFRLRLMDRLLHIRDAVVMDPSRRIRSAHPADAASLLAIYGPVVRDSTISFELDPPTEEEFTERIRQTDPWLVLERDADIAGYACASQFRNRPGYAATRETTVFVHPDHHRSGAAHELMTALLANLTDRGAHLALAVIALPNEPSVALHEALGFTLAGTLHQVGRKFGRWHDEGFWQLPLER